MQVIVIACKPYILKLEAASGFEPEIAILQTAALPLGYAAPKKMERETGFEPATSTLARSHSTTELFPLNSLVFIDKLFDFVNRKIYSLRRPLNLIK